jgi:hypothetical protein
MEESVETGDPTEGEELIGWASVLLMFGALLLVLGGWFVWWMFG